jgi:light-regulated signal transduction histidine kinase (bacteriophytochrome)
MGELIDSLLSFSRIGKQEVDKKKLDMDLLVKSEIEELQLTEEGKKASWNVKKLEPCYGDSQLIKQVVINLLSNAVKYSSKKALPEIEIGSVTKENEIIYSVKDNGAGFDMKYYHKLFGVFQRLHRSSEFEGTGVGLATIQRIIMKHHGRVWAEASPDKGASFYFSLPVNS